MLYLTRKPGDAVIINNAIEVTVVEVKGKAVKLGFTFPSSATVLRKEIHDKILEENMAAVSGNSKESLDSFILSTEEDEKAEQN